MSEQTKTAVLQGEVEGLGQTQETALAALRTGSTFRQAAQEAGVSRPTIYRWVQSDPHFRAAYNAWKQEQTESARSRLIRLTDKAVDVVEHALAINNERVALHMLKNTGAMGAGRRESTDPKVVKLQMEVRRLRGEFRAAEAMVKHLLAKAGLSAAQQRRFIREHGIRSGADLAENTENLGRFFPSGKTAAAKKGPVPACGPRKTTHKTAERLSRENDDAADA